jgi:hypothetical protein
MLAALVYHSCGVLPEFLAGCANATLRWVEFQGCKALRIILVMTAVVVVLGTTWSDDPPKEKKKLGYTISRAGASVSWASRRCETDSCKR